MEMVRREMIYERGKVCEIWRATANRDGVDGRTVGCENVVDENTEMQM